ncbi:hypothetical protein IEQ34_016711 [Dendrobium chrysotoxum]|uniref:Receptor ligand binding region domain-containing protein n=1 Tax=Dendrobium chrysotoxum TaxID=161865 RepID=A0AAV7GH49_DENCH|nr:hypothetical protein IEQ34_016711 [Dendrobium chrysotoxum]
MHRLADLLLTSPDDGLSFRNHLIPRFPSDRIPSLRRRMGLALHFNLRSVLGSLRCLLSDKCDQMPVVAMLPKIPPTAASTAVWRRGERREAYDFIINAQVRALIGPQSSGASKFVAELGSKFQMPTIPFTTTSPSLSFQEFHISLPQQ